MGSRDIQAAGGEVDPQSRRRPEVRNDRALGEVERLEPPGQALHEDAMTRKLID
jgi:hypothetical protein